jgi:MYXO-CTERM domain-containing protein
MKRLIVAGICAALVAGPGARAARACGGFFCDRPSTTGTLPIAQAAENVLFVMGKDQNGAATVDAHIQILYTGPASKFSWIVPVTSVPTVSVGSDILFERIEPPTRPSFSVTYQLEGNCSGVSGVGAGCGSSASGGANSAGFGGVVDAGGPGVNVLAQGSIGPYDYVVIKSQDGATLQTWLTDNGYFVSPESGKIVDDYVAGQYSFVAVKLQNGQSTSAVRPIVLHLLATESCLPLKLTAIAATPDLRINVWVLASARAVPINYAEISINQAKLDWFGGGKNYDQLLKDGANEAQGNAFAVEYAMPATNSTSWFTLSTTVRSDLAAATTPPQFMYALGRAGLPATGAVLQVLRVQIPLPATLAAQGITEASFYGNMDYYWNANKADFAPFDPAAATTAMDTDVLSPLDSYRTLFAGPGRLTRLATFISPEEMTKDPLFVPNPSLPDVAPQHMAVAHVMCGNGASACAAPVRLQTEDGEDVNFRPTSCMQYDRGDLDQLPASAVAWARDQETEGQVVVDNRPQIAAALQVHNAAIIMPTTGSGTGNPRGTLGGGSGGCGCTTAGPPGLVLWLTVAGGLALSRRRRRRRR